MEPPLPYRIVADGLRLDIRLTPRARQDALEGVAMAGDGRAVLRVRLRAPPVEGAANAALLAFMAKALSLRGGAITLMSGAASRSKQLHLAGNGAARQVEAWIEGNPAGR